MKQILKSIQERISGNISAVRYVDRDWGQFMQQSPPVKYPAVLISIQDAEFSDYKTSTGGGYKIKLNIAVAIYTQRLTRTSAMSPGKDRDEAWQIYNLAGQILDLLTSAGTDPLFHPLSATGMQPGDYVEYDSVILTFKTGWNCTTQ
jgi:hypothetical protein